MPALRPSQTTEQQIIAFYSYAGLYECAESFAQNRGCRPGTPRYVREVTHFVCDLETRIYGNRQTQQRDGTGKDLWALRRTVSQEVTGQTLLLATPPSEADLRKWRYRRYPSPVPCSEDMTRRERHDALAAAYKAGLPEHLGESPGVV